jgi:predicted HTH transcriptional regulator
MRPKKILEIIAGGESSTVEFKRKSSSAEKIAKEITAFANTSGGMLFIGVEDNGDLFGVESEKTELDIVEQACKFCIEPPVIPKEVKVQNLYDKEIVIVEIEESTIKPHKLIKKDETGKEIKKAYIRIGEKSVMASSEMTRLMREKSNPKLHFKLSIGQTEQRLFSYLETYERTTVLDFANLVNISKRRSERLLITLVRAGVLQIHNDMNHDYFTLK